MIDASASFRFGRTLHLHTMYGHYANDWAFVHARTGDAISRWTLSLVNAAVWQDAASTLLIYCDVVVLSASDYGKIGGRGIMLIHDSY